MQFSLIKLLFWLLTRMEYGKVRALSQGAKSYIVLQDYPKITLVILTFNALEYVQRCFHSLPKTSYPNFETLVVDNHSDAKTIGYLKQLKQKKLIHKLVLSTTNLFFAKGNNKGVGLSANDTRYVVLMNSDVEIQNPNWLSVLVANADDKTIISFGYSSLPLRPDGWCFMIPLKVYRRLGGLNEFYQMNWSITHLTASALAQGYRVKTILNPNAYIMHFKQKSYPNSKKLTTLRFNQMSTWEAIKLFWGYSIQALIV